VAGARSGFGAAKRACFEFAALPRADQVGAFTDFDRLHGSHDSGLIVFMVPPKPPNQSL
jgi:hypothetical protein